MMQELCDKAEVRPFGFHALRHYAASVVAQSGEDILNIQLLLGHERPTTTDKYLHRTGFKVRGGIDALEEALKEGEKEIEDKQKKSIPLETHGLVLGAKEDMTYQEEEISIKPEDRLLIYSDGIPEAMNEQMEEYGDERLSENVRRHRDYSAGTLIENIMADLKTHFGNVPQNDDMTMILLIRKTK